MSEKFDYDSTNNIIQLDDIVLEYGPGDTLQRQGDTQYFYDGNGRLIKKIEDCDSAEPKVWLFEWDAEDQLRSVTTPTGDVWEYKYDALGRRIVKEGPKKTTRFVWDGDVVVHEVENEVVNSSWVFEPGSFSPQCKVQNNQLYSVICDHLGTPRELVDIEGNIVWSVSYKAWGEIEQVESQEVYCPIRFQGQWFDEESRLYYNRFRYYDPQDGRFISPDPIRLVGGINTFLYGINPIGWMDPFGLSDCNKTPTDEGTDRPWKEGADPNSIYTQRTRDGKIKSISYYDDTGKQFSREDYTQKASHKVTIDGEKYNLKNHPHEHQNRTIQGPSGPYLKKQVRILDANGKPITGWVNEK